MLNASSPSTCGTMKRTASFSFIQKNTTKWNDIERGPDLCHRSVSLGLFASRATERSWVPVRTQNGLNFCSWSRSVSLDTIRSRSMSAVYVHDDTIRRIFAGWLLQRIQALWPLVHDDNYCGSTIHHQCSPGRTSRALFRSNVRCLSNVLYVESVLQRIENKCYAIKRNCCDDGKQWALE